MYNYDIVILKVIIIGKSHLQCNLTIEKNLIFSDRVLSEMMNNFRGYTEYKLYYAAKYSQSATVARVVSRLLAEAFFI